MSRANIDVLNNYTLERIDNAKRLIAVLERVPEEKRDFVAMLGVAFLSGVESSGMIGMETQERLNGTS